MPMLSRINRQYARIRRNLIPLLRKLLTILAATPAIIKASRQKASQKADASPGNLVIFILPPAVLSISGGIFSILNLASLSRKLLGEKARVYVSWLPGKRSLPHYPYFPSEEVIYNFQDIMRLCPEPGRICLHIPEFLAKDLPELFPGKAADYLFSKNHLHVNILNQNILYMPTLEKLASLAKSGCLLTQTTALAMYASKKTANRWQMPVTHLPAVFWDDYKALPYGEKRQWIAYSPEANSSSANILKILKKHLPDYRLIRVSGLPYKNYLALIARCKFVISFGEGWDSYFFEPFLCGTISFTTFNRFFFERQLPDWPTLYKSQAALKNHIVEAIKTLDNPREYEKTVSYMRGIIQELFRESRETLRTNLRNFYSGNYGYLPEKADSPPRDNGPAAENHD